MQELNWVYDKDEDDMVAKLSFTGYNALHIIFKVLAKIDGTGYIAKWQAGFSRNKDFEANQPEFKTLDEGVEFIENHVKDLETMQDYKKYFNIK